MSEKQKTSEDKDLEQSKENGSSSQTNSDETEVNEDIRKMEEEEKELSNVTEEKNDLSRAKASQHGFFTRLSAKSKIAILLTLILMVAFIVFYIPDRKATVSGELKELMLKGTDLPENRFIENTDLNVLKILLSKSSDRKVMKEFPSQNPFQRVFYNLGYFAKKLLPPGIAGYVTWISPSSKDVLVVRFTLRQAQPLLKYQGRSVKQMNVTVNVDDLGEFSLVATNPVTFFDSHDSAKLIALFVKLYDDPKTPFNEKYDKLLDITSLALRYYNNDILISKELEPRHLVAYKTFCNYLRFKKNDLSNFMDSEPTDLIRCFLYDSKPPQKDGKINLAGLIEKLDKDGVANLTSENTFQIELLLEKFGSKLTKNDEKGFVLLLLSHPEPHAKSRLKSYTIKEDPGTIVHFIDSVDLDYFDGLTDQENQKLPALFLDILYDVFRETPYLSVKRQALVTMYRLKAANPDKVERAMREARSSNIPRLNSTVKYLTESSN